MKKNPAPKLIPKAYGNFSGNGTPPTVGRGRATLPFQFLAARVRENHLNSFFSALRIYIDFPHYLFGPLNSGCYHRFYTLAAVVIEEVFLPESLRFLNRVSARTSH